MKRYITILFILGLLMPFSVYAQKKKSKKNTKKPVVEIVQEDPRIAQMLEATQKIMFIDSLVVDSANFMRFIPIAKDCGTLVQNNNLGQFTNELKDFRLTTVFDAKDSISHICVSDYIGNTWTTPVAAKGINKEASANYPFMMPDGTTLYFSQKGANSLGGYDIFVTRYDGSEGTFLKPENLGMPFASTANDYFFAIDEFNNLGYFVTDRHQPRGKVCIYVFIPNETRQVYQSEAYSETELRALADINCIAKTWDNSNLRKTALNRYREARQTANVTRQKVISEFSSELDDLRHQAEVLNKALRMARNYYARANKSERQTLRSEILKSEQELEQLQLEIRKKEKAEQNDTLLQ